MLMSAELKGCVTWFIYFLDLLWVRYNCAKFHRCRICVTDFRERGSLFGPPIREQSQKSPSWIGWKLPSPTIVHTRFNDNRLFVSFFYYCHYYFSLVFFYLVFFFIKWLCNYLLNFSFCKYISSQPTSIFSKLVLLPGALLFTFLISLKKFLLVEVWNTWRIWYETFQVRSTWRIWWLWILILKRLYMLDIYVYTYKKAAGM